MEIDIETIKKLAGKYGFEITKVKPGEGGFFIVEHGNKRKIDIEKLFSEIEGK